MKKITQLLTALVFCSLIIFASCKKDDGGTTEDPRIAIGQNLATVVTGAPSCAKLGTGECRDEWKDFNLKFTFVKTPDANGAYGGTYTVSGVPAGGENVWGDGGAWTFANAAGTKITFDNKTADLSASDKEVTLIFDVAAAARVAVFEGKWTFTWK